MKIIEAKNLEKIYFDGETQTEALKRVSFSIDSGEFVAIMGPSGSGKSTLLHILGCLDAKTSGEYFFGGKSIDDYSELAVAEIRNKKMGFVFQFFNLLPRTTVLENVKLPLLYSGVKESLWNDIAKKAIDSVGLSHRTHFDVSRLSGGEKQRVAIARALINNPDVIFADEPTGNLDSKSGQIIMEILQRLNEQGRTILLITHETYTANVAKRIIKIRDGLLESDNFISQQKASQNYAK